MTQPLISIIGFGADGLAGLSAYNRSLIAAADYIIAPKRLAETLTNVSAEIHIWPVPFDPMFEKIKAWKGKQIVILATGDPLWHGVGSIIARKLKCDEYNVYPAPSAFSLAAARLGWPLAEIETLTLHGYSRPTSLILPYIQPGSKILTLTGGNQTVHEVAEHLNQAGFGASLIHVLENMGAENEQYFCFEARAITKQVFAEFNTLGIECIADQNAKILPRTAGLPDTAFNHDGQLTKQQVRAITGSALAPAPGQLLWDVGAGCGSIGIEWMRHHSSNRALAFENNSARIELIKQNAQSLGTPYLKIIEGTAPNSLKNQPAPDAIFIGGGISTPDMFETCWQALKPSGRLIVNCVTIASQQKLFEIQSLHGGDLIEIAISSLRKLGTQQAMRPALPVLQWRITK